jgi:ABC-type sugar transport system ATPase subunit
MAPPRNATPAAARDLGIGVVRRIAGIRPPQRRENLFINAHLRRGALIDWRAMQARAAAVLRELGADTAGTPAGA